MVEPLRPEVEKRDIPFSGWYDVPDDQRGGRRGEQSHRLQYSPGAKDRERSNEKAPVCEMTSGLRHTGITAMAIRC